MGEGLQSSPQHSPAAAKAATAAESSGREQIHKITLLRCLTLGYTVCPENSARSKKSHARANEPQSFAVEAQVFEITRELGAPQHFYLNSPPFSTIATDALPVPAAPNVVFAISGNSTIRLRLVAPAGKKFVASRPVNFSWPGDLNLIPVGSGNSGILHVCPTSWSFTTLAGTVPVSAVEGYKTDADWLKIRATGTSPSSANFEFTEIVLAWNVTGFTGASHLCDVRRRRVDQRPGDRPLLTQGSGTRLTRITGSGTTHPNWLPSGVLVANNTGQLIADGVGGVYVCWNSSTPTGLRLTRLTALRTYASGWLSAGLAVATTNPTTFALDIGRDGSHVNLAWTTSTGEVRASRTLCRFDPSLRLAPGPVGPGAGLRG